MAKEIRINDILDGSELRYIIKDLQALAKEYGERQRVDVGTHQEPYDDSVYPEVLLLVSSNRRK